MTATRIQTTRGVVSVLRTFDTVTSALRHVVTTIGMRYLRYSYADAVLVGGPNGSGSKPLSWWRLNETSGTTAVDLGSGGNNGTYTGGYTQGQSGPTADGSSATLFNGVTGRVSIAALGALPNFSVEGWCLPNGNQSDGAAIVMDRDTAFALLFNGGTTTLFGRFYDGVANRDTASGTAINGSWNHVVLTFDGTNLILYVNNVVVSSVVKPFVPVSSATGVYIGSHASNIFFNGTIGGVAVYNRVLSAAEVSAHYTGASYSRTLRTN